MILRMVSIVPRPKTPTQRSPQIRLDVSDHALISSSVPIAESTRPDIKWRHVEGTLPTTIT
jgi:hypothetical protein